MPDASPAPVAAAAPAPVTAPTSTHVSFWSHLYQMAALVWHTLTEAGEDVKAVEASHPQVVAAAEVLIAAAPPEVRVGVNVAAEVVKAVNVVNDHVNEAKA
jgi:hypothetical protein